MMGQYREGDLSMGLCDGTIDISLFKYGVV